LIATNETQRRIQIERGGAAPARCHVVRNGPDSRFLEQYEPITQLRHDGRLIIGYVGMMGVQDGVDYLLRAINSLRKDFGRRDFLAVIVGSGPALDDLQRLSMKLELQQDVMFAGYRSGDDLLRHLASFDICITPDPSNPYNDSCTTIKTMEYMAMAKPVVAFDLPENRLTAGDAALYASRNCEHDLARLIAHLMNHPEERALLGQRGRQRVIDLWRWEIQQNNLIEPYDGLLFRDLVPKARNSTYTEAGPIRPGTSPRAVARTAAPIQH
jgi:glycosyltransferase involved in cell wall biosynthesis